MITMRLMNASALAEFYGRVGLPPSPSVLVLLEKLRYLHVENRFNTHPILHVITRSRMIDIHGREGRHRVDAAMAHNLFQAVLSESDANSVIAVTWDSYMVAYRRASKREKRLISSVFKWMDNFATAEATAAIPAFRRLLCRPHYAAPNTINDDWKFLRNGGPDHLPIFERCLLNGNSISCDWGYSHDAGLSYCESKTVSLELLSRLNARNKCPTILSWWAEDDKGDILQKYGIPAFFLRLDYTSSCMDQAYACMLHIPSPDLYRKYQYFMSHLLKYLHHVSSQTILVNFKQYPHVLGTIHVKLLAENWSQVQTLCQG